MFLTSLYSTGGASSARPVSQFGRPWLASTYAVQSRMVGAPLQFGDSPYGENGGRGGTGVGNIPMPRGVSPMNIPGTAAEKASAVAASQKAAAAQRDAMIKQVIAQNLQAQRAAMIQRNQQQRQMWQEQVSAAMLPPDQQDTYIGWTPGQPLVKAMPYGPGGVKKGENPYQGPEFTENDVWLYGQQHMKTAAELASWRKQAVSAGIMDPKALMTPTYGAVDAQAMALLMAQVNTTQMRDPMAYLNWLNNPGSSGFQDLGGGGSSTSGGGGSGSGGSAYTQTIYNKTSVGDGKAMLRNLMTERLGRAPTDTELRKYMASLNKEESRTPTVVKYNVSAGGSSTQRTVKNAPNASEQLRGQVVNTQEKEINQFQSGQYADVIRTMLGMG